MTIVMRTTKRTPIAQTGLLLMGFIFGCAPHAAGGSDDQVGEANLAVTTVPPSVLCIQILVTAGASTVTRNVAVTSGGSSIGLSLGQLPLGNVTISGQAFSQACTAISGQTATWIADPQQVILQAGVVPSININFRPNNATTATANFVGNVTQVALGYPATVSVVLSDGSVHGSGNWVLGSSGGAFATIPGLSNVTQLAWGGSNLGCAIYNGGSVECFGDNSTGNLGNGTTTNSYNAPVPISNTSITAATQIATGGASCVIDRNYGLYCWGFNLYGQVGNGTTTNVLAPAQIDGAAVSVATGPYTTCAILWNGGQVECWGLNSYGEVGNNSTTNVLSPTWLTGVTGYTQLALGTHHSCALRGDGTVKCWGAGYLGQLGTGNNNGSPVPVAVPGQTSVQQIVALADSTCARKANGTVWCWGSDADGELGDGTGTNSNVPIQVQGIPASAALAAGPSDICSFGTNQSLYCWGLNGAGQFGNGTKAAALLPVQVNP